MKTQATGERILHGTGVSSGIIVGKAYCAGRISLEDLDRKITPDEIDGEINRLEQAIDQSKTQLRSIQSSMKKSVGEDQAAIFESFTMILDDPSLTERIEKIIS